MPTPIRLYDQHGHVMHVTQQAWPAAIRQSKIFDGLRDRGGLATESDTYDLPTLRQRSAALLRGGSIGNALVGTMLSGIVGVGLEVLPEIHADRVGLSQAQADDLEERLRDEWMDYAVGLNYAAPDQSFADYLTDLVREALEFGDVFVVKIRERGRAGYETRTQVIEAVRVSNDNRDPESVHHNNGIHFDTAGRPTAYDVANADPQWTGTITWERVNAQHVIHTKLPRQRYGAARGVPWLSPVIGSIQALGEYSSNEVLASWIQALYVLIHTTDLNHDDQDEQTVEPGTVFRLRPEESLTALDTNKPTKTFSDFYFSQLKAIASAVGLPFELVLRHFQASYSASRAAILQGEALFKLYRQWIVKAVCQPLYERFVDEAVQQGHVRRMPTSYQDPALTRYFRKATWLGQPAQALDLWRMGQGLTQFDQLGILSKRRLAAEHFGVDYRRMQKERAMEDAATGETDT